MAPLATAYIRLRSDSSHLAGDVRRDATKAGAEGGAVMGREFGTAFRRVSRTLIGLGIGTFAVEAGRFAIDMADKFEASRARVENITKNLGGDFSTISGQVQSLDDRMAAFGFTNADVEGSFASLESVTKSAGQAFKDTALAADIARGRGISLAESTSILMRVETGHVAMLSRLGIATKDSTGHLLTQGQALDMLRAKYQNAASTFSKTSAGEQAALRAQLGNTAAQIGAALLPAAVDLGHVLQHDVLPPLEHTARFFDRNRKAIEPMVGLVLKLALAYKAVKLAQSGLKAIQGLKAAGAAGLGAEAVSVAKPVPVFVTNWTGGGGKVPPIVTGGSRAAAGAEAAGEASAGATIGAAMAANLGRGALILSRIAQAVKFAPLAFVGAQSDLHRLPAQDATFNTLNTVNSIRRQAGQTPVGLSQFSGALSKLGVDPYHGVATQKQLRAVALAFTATARNAAKLADSEHGVGGAADKATLSLHKQYKALTNHQASALALSQGMDDLRSAVHNMAVTVGGQSSRALKGNSDDALANRDALRGAVSQAENYLTVLKQHDASAQHVTRVQRELSRAIGHNADETYGDKTAVHDLLKQLGFLPEVLHHVKTAFDKATDAQDVFSTHAESLAQRGIFGPAAKKKAKDAGGDLGGAVGSGYSHVVDKSVADASKKAADAAKAAFDAAKSKMQADVSTFKGFFASQRESLISSFGSLNLTPRTDSFGDSGPAASFRSQLRQQARQMDTFVHLYKRLSGEGLDERLLLQIEGLGPDAIPAMRQLLQSGRKGVRQVNRLERRISHDATTVAAADTSAKFGNQMHADLEKLPHKLAVEMRKELPKAVIKVSLEDIGRRRAKRIRTS